MACFTCTNPIWKSLSRAAAKSAAAKMRSIGLLPTTLNWPARASICEQCPLRTIHNKTSYCGRPYLDHIDRDESTEGCGCPTLPKAKDPTEHCPLTPAYTPATQSDSACNCKWCSATRPHA